MQATRWWDRIMPELFLALVLVLVACGVLMTYSASVFYAQDVFHDRLYFFRRELLWIGLGLVAGVGAWRVHYQVVQRLSWFLLVVATLLLGIVFVPGVGKTVNHATRWLTVGGLTFQPSELAKYAIIIFVADRLARARRHVQRFFRGVCVPLLISMVPVTLIALEPDLGTPLVIVTTIMIMFYVAGTKLWHLAALVLTGVPFVVYEVVKSPARVGRVLAFLNPDADPQRTGFQIRQSLIAIGSGRLKGVGLGMSVQKKHYLPEAHTDFIFAIVGEELGFVGAAGLVLLFMALFTVMYRMTRQIEDMFGHLVVTGILALLSLQCVINIGVVTGCLPTKGIPLPFISYGGTSMVMTLAACGLVVNIVTNQRRLRHEPVRMRGREATLV
ncbi:MAG: putative lipid II flippase FtsW [bacterium]|nr:putative lipid II flippase FtsW [bacterium]